MIIQPFLPSGHTIFCDDIRQEVTGKMTVVGMYSNVMFVSQIPSVLSKLCCFVTYREDPTLESPPANVRIVYDAGEEVTLLADATIEVPKELKLPPGGADGFIMRELKMHFELSPLEIKQPGFLRVRAYRGDDEIRLGSLRVEAAPQEEQSAAERR